MIRMIESKETQLEIFQGLKKEEIAQLQPFLEIRKFPKGKTIFFQGDAAKYLYILVYGEVDVRYKPYDAPALTVARIKKGMVFGWSAAMNRESYTSAAIAKTDCSAYRIHADALHHLCDYFPETGAIFLDHLAGLISRRIQSTHSEILNILKGELDTNGECLRRIQNNGTEPESLS